jgi:hypothetical protein
VTDIVDVMESTVHNSPESFGDKTNEVVMAFDLAVDEARRRSAMLRAIGAHWDPAVVLANELAACEMLYSGLDGPTPADLRLPCDRACHPAPAEQ